MNANELADELENGAKRAEDHATIAIRVEKAATMLRKQQAEIESLNQRIERMIENQSHHEGIAHAGGFEAGWQSAQAEIEALKAELRLIDELVTGKAQER
jgi:hypothetical protein